MSMELSYDVQGDSKFLVVKQPEGNEFDSLIMGMITNNLIPGVAQASFTQVDDVKYVKYNVTSRVTLREFLRNIVQKDKLVQILSDIARAMNNVEEYMIDQSNILLDMDYIFVDPETGKALTICLPLSRVEQGDGLVVSFFKNLMFSIQYDRRENCEYVTRIISFLNESQTFSATSFLKLMDEVIYSEAAALTGHLLQQPLQNEYTNGQDMVNQPDFVGQTGQTGYTVQTEQMVQPSFVEQPKPVVQPGLSIPGMETSAMGIEKTAPDKKKKGLFGKKDDVIKPEKVKNDKNKKTVASVGNTGFAIPGTVQSIGNGNMSAPVPPVVSPQPAPIPEITPNPQKDKVNTGFLSSFKKKDTKNNAPLVPPMTNHIPQPVPQPQPIPQPQPVPVPAPAPAPVPTPVPMAAPVVTSQIQPQTQSMNNVSMPNNPYSVNFTGTLNPGMNFGETTTLDAYKLNLANDTPISQQSPVPAPIPEPTPVPVPTPVAAPAPVVQPLPQQAPVYAPVDYGSTTVLNPSQLPGGAAYAPAKAYASLVRKKNNEVIILDKANFRIGKEKSTVDYFVSDNSAVSRNHANIINRNDVYYIIDNRATNHTYVSGRMIPSDTEIELKDGDIIMLGNEEFQFKA